MRHMTLGVVCAIGLATVLAAQRPSKIGYEGSFPSEAGQRAAKELYGTLWQDEENQLGGGEWRIEPGGVQPHPLGPGRADVIEMRSARTKGPHVRLVQGKRALFFPTRTDGDVKALLLLLGREVPEGLVGEPGPEFRAALARVRRLGEPAEGLRAGVAPHGRGAPHVEVLVWNFTDGPVEWVGVADLRIDGTVVPVALRWPPKPAAPEGMSRLRLDPGSTYELRVEVDELVGPGTHEVDLVLLPATGATEPVRSARVRIEGGKG